MQLINDNQLIFDTKVFLARLVNVEHRSGLNNNCFISEGTKPTTILPQNSFKDITDKDYRQYKNFVKLQVFLTNPLPIFNKDTPNDQFEFEKEESSSQTEKTNLRKVMDQVNILLQTIKHNTALRCANRDLSFKSDKIMPKIDGYHKLTPKIVKQHLQDPFL